MLVELLRQVGRSMIESHQIALETGSDGGGQGATPWMEEGAGALPRLEFTLEDGKVAAKSDGELVATGPVSRDLPYEWVEKVVTKWIVNSVKKKREGA